MAYSVSTESQKTRYAIGQARGFVLPINPKTGPYRLWYHQKTGVTDNYDNAPPDYFERGVSFNQWSIDNRVMQLPHACHADRRETVLLQAQYTSTP